MARIALIFGLIAAAVGCTALPEPEPPREGPRTSGAAHFQLAPLEHAIPDARCSTAVTLPSSKGAAAGNDGSSKSLIEDDAQGADVTCRFDQGHFEAALYGDMGGLELRGTFDGLRSIDTEVHIDLPGARYRSIRACTVVFERGSGGVLSGWFSCPDVETAGAASACGVTAKDANGTPTSFFHFEGCSGL